eukprot:TRINITY_DN33184_c0_g1_i1.p1 TRINITY_DN33184_c0_g1~~TRINITY_DN33184_c0_g1_i1.p1  ORF type:complete len:288 (-),score=69.53 TRINITY_DN33184_c0_g1_i1:320-1183(-)
MRTSDVELEPQQIGAPSGLRQRPKEQRLEEPTYNGEDSDEDEGPYAEQVPLPEAEQKWAKILMVGCACDLLGSLTILVTAFKYAYRDYGVSLYAMGFQATSHWLASALLLLRTVSELRCCTGPAEQSLLIQQRRTQLKREQCISICMGIVMLLSATGLLFKAFTKIRFWEQWLEYSERQRAQTEIQLITEWLAWTGFAIYFLQAVLRSVALCKTSISVLSHSLVVSIVSLLFLFVLGLAASHESEGTWKAEPIAAIVLVVVTLCEGIRIIICYLDDMNARLRFDSRA